MTTETVHPMVMKAARAMCDSTADLHFSDMEIEWQHQGLYFIRQAQAALTECGALECLGALESARRALAAGTERWPPLSVAYHETDAAIAKVYGISPE